MTKSANTVDALQNALKDSQMDDSWGSAHRFETGSAGENDRILGSKSGGQALGPDISSLDMESSFLFRTGREPTHDELVDYLNRHNLQSFLTDMMMYVARHFPPDPFEFILTHIHAMVMKHRAASSKGMGASGTKVEHPDFSQPMQLPADVSEDVRRKVVQHVATVLRHDATTSASGTKLFDEFGTGEKLVEEGFQKLFTRLQAAWGLQPEDTSCALDTLKRWRFRANAASGTRGLPLWPLSRADFVSAYPGLLRTIRDRYVPMGGRIHRALFIRQSNRVLEDVYKLGPKLGRGAFGEVRLVTLKGEIGAKTPASDIEFDVRLIRQVADQHATTPSPEKLSRETQHLSISTLLQNFDLSHFLADSAFRERLEAAMKLEVAKEAGHGIVPEDITLTLSQDGKETKADIIVPNGAYVGDLSLIAGASISGSSTGSAAVRRVCKRVERTQQKVPEEEFNSEVDLLRGLDHPNIIRLFEYFEDESYIDMLMEPVFGGTLTHIVNGLFFASDGELTGERPAILQESWVAMVMAQLLGALKYAHDVAAVIHKDLKTDNVLMVGRPKLSAEDMLKEPVHVMLADFGIAEVFSPMHTMLLPGKTQDNTSLSSNGHSTAMLPSHGGRSQRVGGTPSYMSPEMFKGSFAERSDIWSLGVICFQVMTGVLPYRGENLLMQAHAVCNPRKHPPWEILTQYKWSMGARWFCQQLLTKDEAARPSAKEASQDPWLAKLSVSYDHIPPTDAERSALHQQHLQSHLMKMALACVTSQLNLSQLHHLNLRFQHYDTSGDGRLSHVELRQVLADVGVTDEDMELIVESLDADRSGVIEYSEFIAGCIDISGENMRHLLRVAFDIFDLDGSGFISKQELQHVLTMGPNAELAPTRPLSALAATRTNTSAIDTVDAMLPDGKTADEVMDDLDVKKQGRVDFDEFAAYLMQEHQKAGERLHAAHKT